MSFKLGPSSFQDAMDWGGEEGVDRREEGRRGDEMRGEERARERGMGKKRGELSESRRNQKRDQNRKK
jgi:hypothetical protein